MYRLIKLSWQHFLHSQLILFHPLAFQHRPELTGFLWLEKNFREKCGDMPLGLHLSEHIPLLYRNQRVSKGDVELVVFGLPKRIEERYRTRLFCSCKENRRKM
jgi:hypothetical protein